MFNLFFRLFSLFCDHEYHIINEREKTKLNFWSDELVYIEKAQIYCPKCRKQKWVSKEKAKSIMNRQRVDAKYKSEHHIYGGNKI